MEKEVIIFHKNLDSQSLFSPSGLLGGACIVSNVVHIWFIVTAWVFLYVPSHGSSTAVAFDF